MTAKTRSIVVVALASLMALFTAQAALAHHCKGSHASLPGCDNPPDPPGGGDEVLWSLTFGSEAGGENEAFDHENRDPGFPTIYTDGEERVIAEQRGAFVNFETSRRNARFNKRLRFLYLDLGQTVTAGTAEFTSSVVEYASINIGRGEAVKNLLNAMLHQGETGYQGPILTNMGVVADIDADENSKPEFLVAVEFGESDDLSCGHTNEVGVLVDRLSETQWLVTGPEGTPCGAIWDLQADPIADFELTNMGVFQIRLNRL